MQEPRRRFRFLKELSEGAFGKVYMAEMITGEGFSSVVAIKLLHGKWAGHQEIAQRSRDEARLLGLLHHRNIVRVEDLTSINGQCAIVMEYLDGVDLKGLSAYLRSIGQRFPRRAAFEIMAQIAGALEAAYSQVPIRGGAPLHVIHRDIKPSNIMVTASSDVKVLDFGTARANFEEREARTQALAFGSQAYMAPERLLGDPDAPAGDVFSLGVTLYEVLSFQSFGKIFIRPERYERALEERLELVDLSDLDPKSASVIRDALTRMLLYEAAGRPSATEVVELMDGLTDVVSDANLQRFARQIVRPCLDAIPPAATTDDPLTGSTLFEDASSGLLGRSLVPEMDGALRAPGPQEAVDDEPPDAEGEAEPTLAHQGAAEAPAAAEAPDTQDADTVEEEPPPEPPLVVPVVFAPIPAAPAGLATLPPPPVPRAVAALPPRPPMTPSAAAGPKKGGGKGLLVAGAALLLLAIAGVAAAYLLGSGSTAAPTVERGTDKPGPTIKGVPGGKIELGPIDGAHGGLKLSLARPAGVEIQSTNGFKQDWDGTGTLEIVGLQAGSYRTRVARGEDFARSTLDVVGGQTCTFTYDPRKGDDWEASGCE